MCAVLKATLRAQRKTLRSKKKKNGKPANIKKNETCHTMNVGLNFWKNIKYSNRQTLIPAQIRDTSSAYEIANGPTNDRGPRTPTKARSFFYYIFRNIVEFTFCR